MRKEEKYLEEVNLSQKNTINVLEERNTIEIKTEDLLKTYQHAVIVQSRLSYKIVFLSLFLTFCGFGLIIAGCVEYSKYNNVEKCLAFWIIGGFCAVPGFFYLGKILKYVRSESEEEKKEIINEMPEWN